MELPSRPCVSHDEHETSATLDSAGAEATGLNHVTLGPDSPGFPQHCHSAEEEIFVVLDGEGTCRLGDESIPVRRGHVVARPAGTRVAHTFDAGPNGLTYLAYGTRDPNDMTYYPKSDKVFLRGLGRATLAAGDAEGSLPHLDAAIGHVLLGLVNRVFCKVEDACRQYSICAAFDDPLCQVFEITDSARSDDWNRNGFRYRSG